jgi:hypothetical protein
MGWNKTQLQNNRIYINTADANHRSLINRLLNDQTIVRVFRLTNMNKGTTKISKHLFKTIFKFTQYFIKVDLCYLGTIQVNTFCFQKNSKNRCLTTYLNKVFSHTWYFIHKNCIVNTYFTCRWIIHLMISLFLTKIKKVRQVSNNSYLYDWISLEPTTRFIHQFTTSKLDTYYELNNCNYSTTSTCICIN